MKTTHKNPKGIAHKTVNRTEIQAHRTTKNGFCERVRGVCTILTCSQKEEKEAQGVAGERGKTGTGGGKKTRICERVGVKFARRPARERQKRAFSTNLPPQVGGAIMIGANCCSRKSINALLGTDTLFQPVLIYTSSRDKSPIK